MKPKLTIQFWDSGKEVKLKLPDKDVTQVEIPERKCPGCSKPLVVSGGNKRIGSFDTYHSEAHCVSCDAHVGTLKLKCSTLFGLEEDQRVFSMGVKIY